MSRKSKKSVYRELDREQQAAVRRFVRYAGLSGWKNALATRWMRGNTQPFDNSEPEDPYILHRLRTSHGPEWLEAFDSVATLAMNPASNRAMIIAQRLARGES